jgi:C4-dicarboxylate-specific signal transduction histidine kinase
MADIGEDTQRSAREIRCLRICNQIALIMFLIVELYAPLYWWKGHPDIALFNVLSGFLILAIVPFNRSQRYPLIGRHLFLFINNILILAYCVMLGRETWPHLFFINMMIVPHLLFPAIHQRPLHVWTIVPALLFFGLEAWGYERFATYVIVTPTQQRALFWLIAPSVFVIVYVYANYLYRSINRHEKALLERIQDLQQSHRTIEEQQLHLAAATHFSAIAELSASVAHEINNPLAIIRGYAEQLEILVKRQDLEIDRVNTIASRVKQTVDRITKITASLRNLSREGADDPFEEADITKIIEDVLSISKEGLIHHGIDLRVEMQPAMAPCVCRKVQIAQVLLSLIHNSKDAVAELAEKWIHIRLEARGPVYDVAVIDSGRGINPQILPRIHQPFFTTKPPGKGTGLGLSISRKILTAHKGHLFVDTKAPHTTFIIRLPRDARLI